MFYLRTHYYPLCTGDLPIQTQYLHWDSHHNLCAENSVFNTLTHRAWAVYAHTQILHKKEEYIGRDLHWSKYAIWALNTLQTNRNYRHNISQAPNHNSYTTSYNNNNRNIYMVVPYTKGLNESFKNFCGKVGVQIQVLFRGQNTIKNLLVAPRTGIISLRKWVNLQV